MQPLWCRARLLTAELYPLFNRLAWALTASVMAGVTCEVAALASDRSAGVGLRSHCRGGHDSCGRCSGLGSLRRLGIRDALLWRARQVRALIWFLIAWSAWTQQATVVARKKVEGAAPGLFRCLGVRLASQCGGGHDRCVRCSGPFSLSGRGISQPLWWQA